MKKVIISFIFFFVTVFLFGQNPTVAIQCNGGTCFFTDPNPTLASYNASINDGANSTTNGWTRQILWVPTGGTVFSPIGQGTPTCSVNWNNTSNTPTKKMKVTVTYTKTGQTNVVISDEKVVVVKYIAPITSMIVTGASPSNPSNGGTTSIPCGTGSFTVSVPTPVTDPVTTVTYIWIKPSTWAGASTTNSITMTPDAGTTDGTISVQAKRADGTVVRTYTVAYVRPRVTNAIITSVSWSPDDKPMCGSATRQLSGASTANATVFNWTTTGGISVVSGASQSIATFSGTSNGQVTLIASNACAASNSRTWKVFAQTPQVVTSDVLVDGHSNNYPNITSGNSTISVQNGSACQSYKWEIYGGSGYINPNSGGCGFSYNGITFNHGNFGSASTSSSIAVRLRTANDCGQGVDVIIPLQTTGGYYRMTSPNPTTNTISLALDDALPRGSLKKINVIRACLKI